LSVIVQSGGLDLHNLDVIIGGKRVMTESGV